MTADVRAYVESAGEAIDAADEAWIDAPRTRSIGDRSPIIDAIAAFLTVEQAAGRIVIVDQGDGE